MAVSVDNRSLVAIYRAALGWFLLAAGALWLVTLATPVPVWLGDWSDGGGYVAGVLARSLDLPYQRALLAGLIAVPLHAAWVFFLVPGRVTQASGYDSFGAWAQTVFTSLGFLGTVIGVSQAVAGLEEAMAVGDPAGLIRGLSTAFDTTFLGLVAALLLMGLRKLVRLNSDPVV